MMISRWRGPTSVSSLTMASADARRTASCTKSRRSSAVSRLASGVTFRFFAPAALAPPSAPASAAEVVSKWRRSRSTNAASMEGPDDEDDDEEEEDDDDAMV